jgi:hypothetical protein
MIDSRTGLSDIAGICTVRFPDTVVDCFTLSTLSIEEAAPVARSIDEQQDRDIQILPAPMRVEDGEQSKIENGRAPTRSAFAGPPGPAEGGPSGTGARWRARTSRTTRTRRPWPPSGTSCGWPNSLLSSYERLTAVLTCGDVREFPSLPDGLRQCYAAGVRTPPVGGHSRLLPKLHAG